MKKIKILAISLAALLICVGCGTIVKYSFTGASIPAAAQTFSVAYFPNNATMVNPTVSSTLSDALVDSYARQTRLLQVDEGGDFAFEGEITGYTSAAAGVSSGTEGDGASLYRLTITVKVRFTNAVDEAASWNRNFSAFATYDANRLLDEVAGELIPEIIDQIVTDIFQASASNW